MFVLLMRRVCVRMSGRREACAMNHLKYMSFFTLCRLSGHERRLLARRRARRVWVVRQVRQAMGQSKRPVPRDVGRALGCSAAQRLREVLFLWFDGEGQ